jgi:hypothetical protein
MKDIEIDKQEPVGRRGIITRKLLNRDSMDIKRRTNKTGAFTNNVSLREWLPLYSQISTMNGSRVMCSYIATYPMELPGNRFPSEKIFKNVF